jgi:hypothetical protein
MVDGVVTMPKDEFEALLQHVAERRTLAALHDVGLEGGNAAADIRELRGLLEAFNTAKRTAAQTIVTRGAGQLYSNALARPARPPSTRSALLHEVAHLGGKHVLLLAALRGSAVAARLTDRVARQRLVALGCRGLTLRRYAAVFESLSAPESATLMTIGSWCCDHLWPARCAINVLI